MKFSVGVFSVDQLPANSKRPRSRDLRIFDQETPRHPNALGGGIVSVCSGRDACAVTRGRIRKLARRLAKTHPELREKVVALERLIDTTIGSVRRIAAELRPQILDSLGLLEAIRWQAREFERRTDIGCSLELPELDFDWNSDRSTAIFRIFQESLTNVARHSGARQVRVRIYGEQDHVVLEVRDNGRGIREDELANAESFGLMGMHERARMFGGVLTVRAAEDSGTTVRVRIPL